MTQPRRLMRQKEVLMRFGSVLKSVLLGFIALVWVASASAQQIRYFPDFSSIANLQLNGAHQVTFNSNQVLRLTPGGGSGTETGSAWFVLPPSVDPNLGRQPVKSGFTTYFKFQIDSAPLCCTPGDGFAFVVQNSSTTARGTGLGGLGYAGIHNSLAIEFDTFQNPWDPNANHVAVQSCGTGANAPTHITGNCLVGSGINSSSSLPHFGVTCGNSSCADGVPHEVVVEYTPPATVGNGTLMVWIDQPFIPGTHTPCPNNRVPGCPVAAVTAINIPYNIDNTQNSQGISLAGGTSAWVGFTASQTHMPEAHDIIAWEFTPHTPIQVQQVIPPGGTQADYVFGGHDMGVNYFNSFVNDPTDPILMTVLATPISRSTFYRTRLIGTQFINEQCVVYLQTGGNCIVYSVTCQRQSNPHVNITCPASPFQCVNNDPNVCITFNTSFYTSDGITVQNADYLKTDPIGSNNWVSIFESYNPNILDGRTTGTGNTPSDFVATFAVGAKP